MPISGGSSIPPAQIWDFIHYDDIHVVDLNHIAGRVPDAGTIPGGATVMDGFNLLNVTIGAVNQWAGVDYGKLVCVLGHRIRCGPNPNPAAGRYRLQYQDPRIAAPTLVDIETNIPMTDDVWSAYTKLPTPVVAEIFVFECTTYSVDADIVQEVELRGIVLDP